ncbi:Altered inheritance of mitochondria protein 1 OS=Saccharomyces cerevisiae (strain ATCC 204508 / S288c) GN=AIM1 PE=1 SV=1 [Rhizoctonia solani AG-1 IB]|uniref:Altered inheritance of mitochondria protein 1 n=1 Tax=Thanatephorus cucumeris (strain AG1-IB / isolate 7/3/14) TaxID=1108050 RepID=A0A0B7FIM4_THACB|nr:Altered inheritance of mitochondria protein 1 OS=Saccharomyces cerevisiae (strain ATCC 204508 / S288c) GN=AIM1 PE=1 SV=1 [Rhizoctonia solani AG-1 IB]
MLTSMARRTFTPCHIFLRSFVASSVSRAAAPQRALTEGEQVVFEKLNARFEPSNLDVEDVSGGCGTFYAISITSTAFKGLPMVKQHKLVTEELKKEIAGFHGLQIKTKAE